MRPTKLIMTGFGPYLDRQELNMDELGTKGLYVITGETGAGKTSILDAICFALYGEPSGTNRSTDMLRSNYVDPNVPTEVELTFLHRGKEYYVRRNLAYMRKYKRGTGETQEPKSATFIVDGKEDTDLSWDGVSAKIKQLLGMDYQQFSRIILLAQGEFNKMLFAGSIERKKIFRELFGTEELVALQEKLKKERDGALNDYKDMGRQIEDLIDRIGVDPEDPHSVEVEAAKEGRMVTADVLVLLEKMVDEDGVTLENLNGKLNEGNKNIAASNQIIGKAQELEASKANLENAEKSLKECEPALEEAKKNLEAAKKGLEGKAALEDAASKLEVEIPNYDKLEELEQAIKAKEENQKTLAEEMETKGNNLKTKSVDLETLEKEAEDLAGTDAALVKAGNAVINAEKEEEEYKDLEKAIRERTNSLKALEEAIRVFKVLDADYQAKRDTYNSMNDSFIYEQAGLMAEDLRKTGKPCPVCGNREYKEEDLAILSPNAPTEEAVKQAKADMEKAEKKRGDQVELGTGLRGAHEEKEAAISKLGKKLFGVEGLDEIIASLGAKKKELSDRLSLLRKAEAEAKNKDDIRKEVEKALPDIRKEVEGLKEELKNKEILLKGLDTEIGEKKESRKEMAKDLKYGSKKEAEQVLLDYRTKAKSLQDAHDAAMDAERKADQEVSNLNKEIQIHLFFSA